MAHMFSTFPSSPHVKRWILVLIKHVSSTRWRMAIRYNSLPTSVQRLLALSFGRKWIKHYRFSQSAFQWFVYFVFQTFIITFIRLIPQTILTFLFFEELRSRFGDEPQPHPWFPNFSNNYTLWRSDLPSSNWIRKEQQKEWDRKHEQIVYPCQSGKIETNRLFLWLCAPTCRTICTQATVCTLTPV